jgi:cell division protein FtsQ
MTIFKRFNSSRTWMLALLAVLLVIIGVIWFSLQFTGKNRTVTTLIIEIKPDSGLYFLTQQDITDIVTKTSGNPIGKSVSDLKLSKLEATLRRMPYVAKAQVFASLDGKLKIQVTQRIPVLRIQNTAFETFFIDSTGTKIPFRQTPGIAAPDVLVANGDITEKFGDSTRIHTPILLHLLKVANFIGNNSFWDAQFEQCYVDNFGDIILVPRVGKHSIVIGSSDNLPQKMENLRVFYEKGLRNLGWDTYSIINLKFRDQVVATRNGKQTEHKPNEHVQKSEH